jgi:putative ABC transport system substrate-binding protein
MFGMKRREFIRLFVGAAAVWPLAARAQRAAMPVIGFLGPGLPEQDADRVNRFRQGLNEAGYVEGRNVAIEYRWAEWQNSRWPELVADLVRREVSVIFSAGSTPAALAAKAATASIPIVFFIGPDPIQAGLVTSLNRPGGNVTGVTSFNNQLVSKRLELLHEAVPKATVAALLVNPTSSVLADADTRDAETAAHTLGLQLHVLHATSERDFDAVFAKLLQLRGGGLAIGGDALFTDRREQLGALAARHSMPAIYQTREFVAAGGLMAYGGSYADAYRLASAYVARVLRGEKPADLPIQQVTKVELIINLKTAKTLGITFPLPLLGRADEVIE